MNAFSSRRSQQGVALAMSLILLTILTLISIYVASTGGLELRMARNMQESIDSFQAAEAGVAAVLGLVRTGPNPFDDDDEDDPFYGISDNPLAELNDGSGSVDVGVVLMARELQCPRLSAGFSADLVLCDHYRVESEHSTDDAQTKIDQGVVKPVIGSASL